MLTPKSAKQGLFVLAMGLGMSAANAHTVFYADDGAALGGDCESWATACKCLQDVLGIASGGPTVSEIHLAGGAAPTSMPVRQILDDRPQIVVSQGFDVACSLTQCVAPCDLKNVGVKGLDS